MGRKIQNFVFLPERLTLPGRSATGDKHTVHSNHCYLGCCCCPNVTRFGDFAFKDPREGQQNQAPLGGLKINQRDKKFLRIRSWSADNLFSSSSSSAHIGQVVLQRASQSAHASPLPKSIHLRLTSFGHQEAVRPATEINRVHLLKIPAG